MNAFLPFKRKLEEQQLANFWNDSLYTKENLENYCKNFKNRAVLLGLMHLLLLKKISQNTLQWDKADIFFMQMNIISK